MSDYDKPIFKRPESIGNIEYYTGEPPLPKIIRTPNKEQALLEGTKYDSGKPPMDLLSSIALTEIAKVLEFGAKKYASHNWRKGMKWSRPASAALRHIFAWLGGESKDPESGLSHLAHAACCLLFLIEYETTRPEFDDRYKDDSK